MSKHLLIGIAGVVSFLLIFVMYLQRTALEPRVLHSNVLLLESGSSLRDFAEMMTQISNLKSPIPIMTWVMITGRSSSLKAGEYMVSTGNSVEDIVTQVVAGKVIEHSITFPEGFEFRDIIDRLNSAKPLFREEGDLSSNLIKQAIGTDHELLEGLFFPDTYHYIRSDTPISILQRANKILIRCAVESVCGVKVESVRTVSVPQKPKRQGAFVGRKAAWKKAYVTLKDGESINVLETA